MKVGIDLVQISRIKDLMEKKETIKKIFHISEITDDPESLAGIFAAKEAYFKAIGKKKKWLDIEIKKNKEGKPYIISDKKERINLSITHEGGYAAAIVIIEDENSN